MAELEDVLAHYGIKGMRWGVRKRRDTPNHSYQLTPEGKVKAPVKTDPVTGHQTYLTPKGRPASIDAATKHAMSKKISELGLDSLTNAELKSFVDRVNLEMQYSKIMMAQAPSKSDSRKFIEKLLKDEGQQLLKGKKGPVVSGVEAILMVSGAKKSSYVGKRRAK